MTAILGSYIKFDEIGDRQNRKISAKYSEKKHKWMGFKMAFIINANAGLAFPMRLHGRERSNIMEGVRC